MKKLKGAIKISLILIPVIVIFLFFLLTAQKTEAAFAAVFVVHNVSSGPIFVGSNAGVNTTFLESGATNVTLNISLRGANGQGTTSRRIIGVNITLPPGFTFFPGDFSNETSNVSANNKTGNIFFNETFSGYTNLTWRNQTGVAVPLLNGSNSFTGPSGQFAFRMNVPANIAKENRGNRTFNITVTTLHLILTGADADSDGRTNHTNTMNITVFINDTIAPNAVRYISPTPANATTITNSTVDFMVAFNETNPDFVNLSVGFPNGTFENRSMTISSGGSSAKATASILGLPAGESNFTVFATDIDNNQVQNSTFYKLTFSSDSTAPTDFRFLSPTVANNTNTTNTTLDIAFNYTEVNPDTAFLQIGFPNGSTVNRTNSTQIIANTPTYAVKGLPDGKHNFTMFANDTNSNQGTNSSLYRIFIDTTPPTATLTLPSASAQKGKSVSSTDLTCTASDVTSGFSSTTFSMNIEKPSAQTVTHTCGTDFTDTFDIGEYKVTFAPQDRAGNTGSKTGTFDVKYAETGVGGGSSSGQSTSSAAEDLAKTILSIGEALTAAKPVELFIPPEIASKSVSKITLEVSEDVPAGDANVEVKALDKIPESDSSGQKVEPLPSEQPVLKTMEFTVPESLTSKMKQATIEFSLTDTELSANGMGTNDVAMARFNSGIWNELPTDFVEAQDSTNKFSSITPGFSIFVVTKKSQPAQPEPEASAKPQAPRVSQYNKTSTQQPGLASLQIIVYLGIVLVIVGAVIFSVKKNYISKIIKK